jgi:hypothetical protein
MGIVVFAVMLMAASQTSAAPDPPPAAELPVSLERIREGLQHPTLKIPPIDPTPVFRASIEGEAPFDNPLQGMRRDLAENPTGVGGRLGGFDVLGAVMGIVKSVKSAYRAHSEAEIRKEVQAALDAFCAEHDCSVLEGPPPMEGIVLPRRAVPGP